MRRPGHATGDEAVDINMASARLGDLPDHLDHLADTGKPIDMPGHLGIRTVDHRCIRPAGYGL